MVQPIAIASTGFVSSVGLSAPASCAAIRAGITNPTETGFIDSNAAPIFGHSVPLEKPWRGRARHVKMAALAIEECLEKIPRDEWPHIPLLLCVAEADRPGRLEGLDDELLADIERELEVRFAPASATIPHGRVAVCVALQRARTLVNERRVPRVLIAGTDSLLRWSTLNVYERDQRLLVPGNSNGFLPGEAGGALLVGRPSRAAESLRCDGLGFATEASHVYSEEPLRGAGLTAAIKQALAEADCQLQELDFRITDIAGERSYFKEAALALARILRVRKEEFDIWHPAECIGESGAAAGIALIAVADAACRKAYAPGRRILLHMANDSGVRAAAVLQVRHVVMGNQVYANDMEVSCKAANGKSICAFPDVCMTPPQTPGTPPGVPIPYPNTGLASDCTDGSSTVKVSGQEVMLKNKSYFKRSTGDEAGCAPKKGVITSSNKGKVYFIAWSMDVKIEGENVVRHLDMSTGNHACPTANEAVPWTYADRMGSAPAGSCGAEKKCVEQKCEKGRPADSFKDKKPYCPKTGRLRKAERQLKSARKAAKKKLGKAPHRYKKDPRYQKAMARKRAATNDLAKRTQANECQQALRCFLPPYNDPPAADPKKVNSKCCPGQTGHHLVPQATVPDCCPGYEHDKAPVICVEGQTQHHGTHKTVHDRTDRALHGLAKQKKISSTGKINRQELQQAVVKVAQRTFRAGCSEKCLNDQLDEYYGKICHGNCKFNAVGKQGQAIGADGSGGNV